jgi:hypothetical protein
MWAEVFFRCLTGGRTGREGGEQERNEHMHNEAYGEVFPERPGCKEIAKSNDMNKYAALFFSQLF